MALHFVSTSVLKANEDGHGQYNEEVLTKEAEARKRMGTASGGAGKTLYQQLADQETLRQEQYDANTKLLRAGPKGLDDDEADWINRCQDEVNDLESRRLLQEKRELEKFKNSSKGRATKSSNPIAILGAAHKSGPEPTRSGPQMSVSAPGAQVTGVLRKRKTGESDGDRAASASGQTVTKSQRVDKCKDGNKAISHESGPESRSGKATPGDRKPSPPAASATALLQQYSGSESDSD